ncbi:MAG: CatB-related O-acetyltransferase [Lachnospiraceae bacterium]|nr:CatB-related O-acetyltransferase [Lachnospiraceae bacterium]
MLAGVDVGYSTYIAPGAVMSGTRIGSYSCIGDVRTVIGRHPVKGENIAIHPAFYSTAKQFGYTYAKDTSYEEVKYADGDRFIVIGSDVWIGFGVMITDGVTIGDGAVIGAGSLVTADVEPYAIYAGTPAKKIGMRFDDATVGKLLELRWWDKGEKWIAEHAQLYSDPAGFFDGI